MQKDRWKFPIIITKLLFHIFYVHKMIRPQHYNMIQKLIFFLLITVKSMILFIIFSLFKLVLKCYHYFEILCFVFLNNQNIITK